MRRLLVITAVMASSGLLVTLPAGPASADSAAGGGGGKYVTQVSIGGNGGGSGGSLGGGGKAVSSSGGGAAVSLPCGYEKGTTQQAAQAGMTKEEYAASVPSYGPGGPSDYPTSVAWRKGILANWDKPGMWYLPSCNSDSQDKLGGFVANNPPQLANGGPPPPPLWVDPEWLEDIARRAMTLPTPDIHYNPEAGPANETYVNVPGGTWFWATQQPGSGGTCSVKVCKVTASLGNQSVTVTATLDSLTFTTNGVTKDGKKTITCNDGGKPYTRGARTDSSNCTLEYSKSSGQGVYTVDSAATWVASSTLGPLPGSVMRDSITLRVAEIQTVTRGDGS